MVHTCTVYVYTLHACVRPLPEVWGRGLPVDLHVTKGGRTVVVLSYHKVAGGVTSPR